MIRPSRLSKFLTSKALLAALLLGNVALGYTAVTQNRIIEGQKRIIRLLFQDSAELAGYKIAAVHKDKAQR